MTESYLSSLQAADLLGIKEQTLRTWRSDGRGPKYIRLGHRRGRVLYRVADVEAWLAEHTFSSTAEEAAACALSRDID